jgi:hypothetical protein
MKVVKILIFLLTISNLILAKDVLNDKNQKLILTQYILESEFNPGAYINDNSVISYELFDKKMLPDKKNFEKKCTL